ncbi:MAG: glycogen debranching enzyme GlgX, partial [Betaproteobacteria bacterium]|nr:glycogen debranching enzyme GlgX [Betaproteobacteria bacterium]
APWASVNFVAVHDGYTLADVTRFEAKHNHANGEDNRDGRDAELARNFGVEGATDDAAILQKRIRAQRAMLATLLLAQGTPMLCAGDEIGKTQRGNNNAYCQDNETSWLDWDAADQDLLAFVQRVLEVRRDAPLLRHVQWLHAHKQAAQGVAVSWCLPNGHAMQHHDWHDAGQGAFACALSGEGAAELRLLFNPDAMQVDFDVNGSWHVLIDSARTALPPHQTIASRYALEAGALAVLQSAQES